MKKKILFIIWSFSYGGGAEKILANIVNNMDPEKYEIEILEYLYVGIKKEKINSNIKLYSPIIDATNKNIFNRIKNVIISKLVEYYPKLVRKIYLNKTYDAEIAFNYMIPTFLLNEKSGKIISWMHGAIYDLKDSKKNFKLQQKSLEKVNNIVAISKKTYNSILDIFPQYKNKLLLVHNGYEFSKIEKMAKEKNNNKVDLLFCGRLDKNKNPIKMLNILKIIKEKGYDYKLGFLGTGELLGIVKNYIENNNLEHNVCIFGYSNNPYSYMNNSKLICMTSYSEGFPTVIIEGMTLGKPFVTTSVAGVDEMYDNGKCGFIIDDDEKYANKIIEILSEKKKYEQISRHCKSYVKKFSIENQIQKLEELINE